MNKISFLTVALLIISILLCGCENPDISESTPSTLAPTTISTPPETTVPRVPDPSEYDCFSIPEEIEYQLAYWFTGMRDEKIDTIVKIRTNVWLSEWHFDFRRMYDHRVDSPLTVNTISQYNGKTENIYMYVCESGRIEFASDYRYREDKDSDGKHAFWSTFYQYALSPETVLPADVIAYEVCCMNDKGFPAAFIGYVTNAGEYILYGNTNTGNLYLIPIETYHLIGDEIRRVEILPQNKNRDILPEDVWDLTPYKVEPKA